MSALALLRTPEPLTAEDVDALNELLEQRFAERFDLIVDDGIERRDPWSLADEELLFTSVALPRETPRFFRDRGERDLFDDLSDLQPFSRTETR